MPTTSDQTGLEPVFTFTELSDRLRQMRLADIDLYAATPTHIVTAVTLVASAFALLTFTLDIAPTSVGRAAFALALALPLPTMANRKRYRTAAERRRETLSRPLWAAVCVTAPIPLLVGMSAVYTIGLLIAAVAQQMASSPHTREAVADTELDIERLHHDGLGRAGHSLLDAYDRLRSLTAAQVAALVALDATPKRDNRTADAVFKQLRRAPQHASYVRFSPELVAELLAERYTARDGLDESAAGRLRETFTLALHGIAADQLTLPARPRGRTARYRDLATFARTTFDTAGIALPPRARR